MQNYTIDVAITTKAENPDEAYQKITKHLGAGAEAGIFEYESSFIWDENGEEVSTEEDE